MSENILSESIDNSALRERPQPFKAIACGGFTVGVLDGLSAVINSGIRGVSPVRVFQYIASGLLGQTSFDGGLGTALLGVFFHFLIAYAAACVYCAASFRFPLLIRQAVICGIIYGVVVYLFMSRVVVPLSAAAKLPFSYTGMFIAITIHMVCVGLPIALITRWSAKANDINI